MPGEAVQSFGNVDGLDVRNGLATLYALEHRKLMLITLHELDQTNQHRLALRRVHARPDTTFEALARFEHRMVDIRFLTSSDLCN